MILIFLFVFFQIYSVVSRDIKGHNSASPLVLLLTVSCSGRLAEIRWFSCISKPQKTLWISFSGTDSSLCIHHLFVWPNFIFLHNSQWITSPTYLFYSYTLYVLICCIHLLCDWWFHFYHHITYICYFVASCLFLLWYLGCEVLCIVVSFLILWYIV